MNIHYEQFGRSDYKDITDMIHALYKEDPPGMPMSTEKITNTLNEFEKHPDKGTIMVLKNGPNVIGYSILANFWSNEFGGNVLIIDELYIKEVYRSQGIGTNFIKHLKDIKFANAVALQLEITSSNKRARKLYESLGFKKYKNDILMLSTSAD